MPELNEHDVWYVQVKGLTGTPWGNAIKAQIKVSQSLPTAPSLEADLMGPDEDDDPNDRGWRHVFAPGICLAVAMACMVAMLYVVGYISVVEEPKDLDPFSYLLDKIELNAAARRATLAYSGVTMAITFALSLTCIFWAYAAGRTKAASYRRLVWNRVLWWFVATFVVLLAAGIQPFASQIGRLLLKPEASGIASCLAKLGPNLMFVLALVVPAILAAGASLMLQPMQEPKSRKRAKAQIAVLQERLKEMDQLLYIGALTLVFGTLQLSAAMSVPLASMPKVADIKIQAELCKVLVPTMFEHPPARLPATSGELYKDRGELQCRGLAGRMVQAEMADSLRQLVKGVTFAFGLAFSALLAAIYAPGVIVLSNIKKHPSRSLEPSISPSGKSDGHADVDPVSRLATIFATLSPLIAGVLAGTVTA